MPQHLMSYAKIAFSVKGIHQKGKDSRKWYMKKKNALPKFLAKNELFQKTNV